MPTAPTARRITIAFWLTAVCGMLTLLPARRLVGQGTDAVARLLASGDTSAAIAAYERRLRRDGRNPELLYRTAVLYLSRVQFGEDVSDDRRRAERHLQLATRLAPDSAKYWFALAMALRTETDVTARLRADETLQRALRTAREHGSHELAEIEYRVGRMAWERYEQANQRHVLVDGSPDIDQDAFLTDWRYVENLLRRGLRPDFRGLVEWRVARDRLESAVAADSGSIPAAGLLAVALGEQGEWDSAAAVTGRLVVADPDSARAWALRALTLTKTNRWDDAAAAFANADARRGPGESTTNSLLDSLLRSADGEPARGAGEPWSRFWLEADPLWSTTANEARLEALARVVYADHRWTDDLRGIRGAVSDRGAVYVRYGPPDVVVTLGVGGAQGGEKGGPLIVVNPGRDDPGAQRLNAAERLDRERVRLLWVYERSRRRYLFGLTPGYARAAFGGAAAEAFNQAISRIPLAFDNIRPDSLALAAYQFRGDSAGRTDLAIFGLPPNRVRPADSALVYSVFVATDTAVRAVATDPEPVGGAQRWRVGVPPGDETVRVEARDADGTHPARGALPLAVRAFGPGFATSDLIIGAGALPSGSPTHWYDVLLAPVADHVSPGTPVTLLWEVYDPPVVNGQTSYTVTVRVTALSVTRHGLVARIVGGVGDILGLSAEGDDVVTLRYRREDRPRPAFTEFVTLDLGDAPAGTYRVEVTCEADGGSVSAAGELAIAAAAR